MYKYEPIFSVEKGTIFRSTMIMVLLKGFYGINKVLLP